MEPLSSSKTAVSSVNWTTVSKYMEAVSIITTYSSRFIEIVSRVEPNLNNINKNEHFKTLMGMVSEQWKQRARSYKFALKDPVITPEAVENEKKLIERELEYLSKLVERDLAAASETNGGQGQRVPEDPELQHSRSNTNVTLAETYGPLTLHERDVLKVEPVVADEDDIIL